MEWRSVLMVGGIDIGLSIEQQSNDGFATVASRDAQWCHVGIVGFGVDIGLSIEQQSNHCFVAAASRNVQWCEAVDATPANVGSLVESPSHSLKVSSARDIKQKPTEVISIELRRHIVGISPGA